MATPEIRDGAGPQADERVDVGELHTPNLREADEPTDGFEPVPVIWIFFSLALAAFGGWYLASYSGEFSATLYDGSPAQTGVVVAQAAKPIDPMLLGKRTFNNCSACHQADGKGLAGQFPPLDGSEWVTGNQTRLVRILLHGLQGDVEVSGKHYNGVMPAWGRFSDEQIAGVLTYIRGSWGNKAAPVEAAAVAEQRQLTAAHKDAWKAAELLADNP